MARSAFAPAPEGDTLTALEPIKGSPVASPNSTKWGPVSSCLVFRMFVAGGTFGAFAPRAVRNETGGGLQENTTGGFAADPSRVVTSTNACAAPKPLASQPGPRGIGIPPSSN